MILTDLTLDAAIAVAKNLPDEDRAVYKAMTGIEFEPESVARHCFETNGPKWCIVDHIGDPLVACGYIRQRPGVYQSWYMAVPRAWSEHGAAVTEITSELIRAMLADGAHRLETVTLASRRRARRWYDRIGLRLESPMQGYGVGGETFVMYVALRPVEAI